MCEIWSGTCPLQETVFVPIYTVGCGEGWVGGHAAPVTVTDLLHVIQMDWVVLK